MSYPRQKPRRIRASRPIAAPDTGNPLLRGVRVYRRKHRGQAAIIIALVSILLIAIVGLAVDGGSSYTERRRAQNASDGAAMAGTRLMLDQYEAALLSEDYGYVDGTAAQEDAIFAKIQDYARTNGVLTSTIETYFVDSNKRLVTAPIGENRGQGHCGIARPCQVGENGRVPWTLGGIGITVKTQSQTDSFFMSIIGWNKVGATARATAFMAVAAATHEISVMPIALFKEPEDFDEFEFDQTYVLLDGDVTQEGGNWGWVTWNGDGSASTTRGWIRCGFNPGVTQAEWPAWCPEFANANGYGPTKHFRSAPCDPNNANCQYPPETTPTWVSYLKYGARDAGWWVQGSSGAVNANCADFWNKAVDQSRMTPDGLGLYIYFPIFDKVSGNSSGDLRYHLRVIANFFINKPRGTYNNPDPSSDISCRPMALPTPTYCVIPCPVPTATPAPSGNQTRWFIRGKAKNFYNSAAEGELGDLRYAFNRTVFLDN